MATALGKQLGALSHQPQRQLLVALFSRNPRDDTPIDSDDLNVEGEGLEKLLDYQNYHLPELEDKGFIDYDQEEHIVTKGPNFEEIEPLIQLIDEHEEELPDDWL